MSKLVSLRALMRTLRAPVDGCPWDRAQTFATLVPHTLEEAYEVADTIERGNLADLPVELGDLLFQVIFYCQLGEEQGLFSFDDVMQVLEHKLRRRHPHVFGDATVADAAAVNAQWEESKADERRAAKPTAQVSELDDVAASLPALTRAGKLQKRAARVGFDWPDVAGAWAKLEEELAELARATVARSPPAIAEELGDLLFAAVNVARHLAVDPEAALRLANRKFERRFRFIERQLAVRGMTVAATDAELLDELWEVAKLACR